MSEIRFCGVLILAITFLLIVRYSLRKENSFLNIREIASKLFEDSRQLYRHRNAFQSVLTYKQNRLMWKDRILHR